MRAHIAAAVAIIGLCAAAPAFARLPVPFLPVPHDAAVIMNTGSTNTPGYRIVVQRDGAVEFVQGNNRATARLKDATVKKVFDDLEAAMPLSKLRAGTCMKSASFGSSTFVYWRHQRSPDVSCPLDPQSAALASSTTAAAFELGLIHAVKVPLPTNEPRRPFPQPSPT